MDYNNVIITTKFEVKKVIHIVIGESAGGSLKYYLQNIEKNFHDEVLVVSEDLSFGPIGEIDLEKGRQNRAKWLLDMYNNLSYDMGENNKDNFNRLHEKIMSINSKDSVLIWHGPNAKDQVALRYLVACLKTKSIYEVNIKDLRSFGECPPEDFGKLRTHRCEIKEDRLQVLKCEWKYLRNSKSNLRVYEDCKLKIVNEDYFDNYLLENCSYNFDRAPRIIGQTMGRTDHLMNDVFLDYRLRHLIQNQVVSMSGELATMRDYSAKLKASLTDFLNEYFGVESPMDEDGFQHILLEGVKKSPERECEVLDVDVTPINDWKYIDMSDKLIVDYCLDNTLSLLWYQKGKERFRLEQVKVKKAKAHYDKCTGPDGQTCTEHSIHFRLENMSMVFALQLKPYLSIRMIS